MPSPETQSQVEFYKRLNGYIMSGSFTLDLNRDISENFSSLASEPAGVTYEEDVCPGTVRPAIWCLPVGLPPSAPVILYFHGGGYSANSPSSHRKMVAHLAKRSNSRALLLDYRLAPEHQFPAQIDDALAAYQWLTDIQGVPGRQISLAGDSAGGNLAVTLALAIKKKSLAAPAAVVCFSPWIDMRLSGDAHKSNLQSDILVFEGAMQHVVQTFVGSASLDEPLLDLLNADYTGCPPMYLTSGGSEVFRDDAVLLADTLKRSGVEVQLKVVEGLQHVWVFMAGRAREADATLEEAAQFIRSKWV
ncbi:hypothetical protein Sste5346_005304 [Sporothrix stenoceras]|uniref:Alpha/beta hydrolase fold-3 domain-containing protein n=1 Tax=Sporothrix stenoceras TaxID=5173 RepID=A0ABR3Z4D8_9PEZI